MIVGNGNFGCAKLASTASQYFGRLQPSCMDHWIHRRSQDEHHRGCHSGSQGSGKASVSGNDVGVDVVQHSWLPDAQTTSRSASVVSIAWSVRYAVTPAPDGLPGKHWVEIRGGPSLVPRRAVGSASTLMAWRKRRTPSAAI